MPCRQCQLAAANPVSASTSINTAQVGTAAILVGIVAVGIYYLIKGK